MSPSEAVFTGKNVSTVALESTSLNQFLTRNNFCFIKFFELFSKKTRKIVFVIKILEIVEIFLLSAHLAAGNPIISLYVISK